MLAEWLLRQALTDALNHIRMHTSHLLQKEGNGLFFHKCYKINPPFSCGILEHSTRSVIRYVNVIVHANIARMASAKMG